MRTPSWHLLGTEEVAKALRSDLNAGLDEREVIRRLAELGPNKLHVTGTKGIGRIVRDQVTATAILILLAAALVSLTLRDVRDAAAIFAIVLLNVMLGAWQEHRAERALVALRRLSAPTVQVRRAGVVRTVSAGGLVAGDLVYLEAGDIVPADLRIIESAHLRTEEAALTGEPDPVEKIPQRLDQADVPLGDRRNLVFMSAHPSKCLPHTRGDGRIVGGCSIYRRP